MPELPEVETIKNQLEKVLVGHKIVGVEVKHPKSFQGNKQFLMGQKITGMRRRAKMIITELANGYFILVHLKMTGQLIYRKGKQSIAGGHPTADWVGELPSKHTRVIVQLDNGATLFFNDQRIFGWMKLVDGAGLEKEFKGYGPDIIDQSVTEGRFYGLLQKSGRAVKLVITDQAKIAGVGNIYANDGLWCAGIDPKRKSREVTEAEANKLLGCLKEVVQKGIRYGGATASDDNYVNASGLGGKYQEHFLAYEQAGKPCQRQGCGGVINKFRLGGRGTYACPVCQK